LLASFSLPVWGWRAERGKRPSWPWGFPRGPGSPQPPWRPGGLPPLAAWFTGPGDPRSRAAFAGWISC